MEKIGSTGRTEGWGRGAAGTTPNSAPRHGRMRKQQSMAVSENRRQLRSYAPPVKKFWLRHWIKAKVVRNRAEFWTFLLSQILSGAGPQKLYPRYHSCLPARHVETFRGVTSTSPKVIGTHTLNFKPNFKCSPLIFWRPLLGCVLASLGQTLARVKFQMLAPPNGRNIAS